MENENETGKSTSGLLIPFIAGAAVGAGLGLLLAPKAGQEIRGKIKDLSADAMEKSKECARSMQEKAKSMIEKGKSVVQSGKEAVDESAQGRSARETQADEPRTQLS